MDDMTPFEHQIGDELRREIGPLPRFDAMSIVRTTTTRSPKWRFPSMFGATKVVVAGAVVALLGGLLLAEMLTMPNDQTMPPAGASASAPVDQEPSEPPAASLDPATGAPGTIIPAGSPAEARRGGHTATRLLDGRVLIMGGGYWDSDVNGRRLVAPAEVWDPVTASFGPAGSFLEGRDGYTSTLLPDGRVLVVGGWNSRDEDDPRLAAALIWDPVSESFGPAGQLADARWHHTATLLPDGRVVIVGGHGDGEDSAEIWDPVTASFSPAGSLVRGRSGHTAKLLPDGRVFVIDSEDGLTQAWAEVWDPATASFSAAGSLAEVRRRGYTTTVLQDGRVLIVGGAYVPDPRGAGTPRFLDAAEVWDPVSASFGPTGSLAEARGSHTATLLDDGRVLIVGGASGYKDTYAVHSSAEIWDPVTASFGPAGSLAERRLGHTATLLPDGRVLIVGGEYDEYLRRGDDDNSYLVASAEIWDPVTASFGPAGSLAERRLGHTATLLPDGRVLIVGGGEPGGPIASAEIWDSGHR